MAIVYVRDDKSQTVIVTMGIERRERGEIFAGLRLRKIVVLPVFIQLR